METSVKSLWTYASETVETYSGTLAVLISLIFKTMLSSTSFIMEIIYRIHLEPNLIQEINFMEDMNLIKDFGI